MSKSTCPECGADVELTAVENIRNGKWTILPLNYEDTPGGDFKILEASHDAVDIMGEYAGTYPIAEYTPGVGNHSTHNPSHYLGHQHSDAPFGDDT